MAEEPDRIRDRIEDTRGELSRDVDRLADRTSPGRVAQRRWSAMKEKVMGTSRQTADAVQDVTAQAGDRVSAGAREAAGTVRQAPEAVARGTQGNPIAAGVIAFGVGLLAASLVPTTEVERRAGQQLKENAGDLVDSVREPLRESGEQLRDDLSGTVREAAGQVQETARDAAQTTADRARSSARQTGTAARKGR